MKSPGADLWFSAPRPIDQAKLRLFCLPYAGGGAQVFRSWAADLPDSVEVVAVQLPGREQRIREPAIPELPRLVDEIATALESRLDRPFALYGHSMGALLAFELARECRRRFSQTPRQLFVSGSRAPHLPDPDPPIHQLPEKEFLEQVVKLNGTPEEVLQSRELLQLLLPTLRADFSVCETYEFRDDAPLACPLTASAGLEDPKALPEQTEPWEEYTSATFHLRLFPGDHFFIDSSRKAFLGQFANELTGLVRG